MSESNTTSKKVLFKIPTPDELQAINTTAEAVVGDLPVIEPDPVATDETVNVPSPKPRKAAPKIEEPVLKETPKKKDERVLFKKPDLDVKKDAPLRPKHHERVSKQEHEDRKRQRKEERLAKQRQLTSIDHIDGITVGSRISMAPKRVKRTARDRRVERRKGLEVTIDGEKKELSETSKYMLDMLLKDTEDKEK